MGRKNRRVRDQVRALPPDGSSFYGTQTATGPYGEDYHMRHMGPSAATKFYICPHCNQNIPPGVGHIVAWPAQRPEHRRHWHRGCWDRR